MYGSTNTATRSRLIQRHILFIVQPAMEKKYKTIHCKQVVAGTASVLSFKDKLAEGVVEPLPIRDGSVMLDVGEAPRLVFVKEK